ncbi:hypothetical protein OUZ56_010249 [Daphnia magna]|uniref:Uncharacterized protein n=1 Tax=Daphnia magna TaxID=35525 RepID=A0ABR0AI32_9CRUS|nr:hypothetical protein OUZ56_010249 [Daphnia magna]
MYQSVVSIYGPLGYGPSTLPLRHSAVIICSLYYILLTAFVALAYFRSTDLWVKARLAAIRGSMEMLCACFHYGVPNPEDEEYPLLLVDTPFLQSVVSIYGPLGYGPSTLPLRHSAVIICSLYYILLTAFVALAYFRSTDLWVKARLAAIRGSMEMLCACFHYGVPNPEDEENPLLLVDTPFLQSVVSIYGPLGYGPSTLPLRHSAVIICSLYYILLTAFVALAYFRSTDLWVKARLAAIRGSMEMLCACFHYGVPNPEDEEYLYSPPERSFDLRTSGLWAQHASAAPLCCHNIAYFRSTDLWVKARLAAIRGSMEMLCACFHYGVPNPEDEEYPLLLVDTPFLQSVVSIYGPLGYGPSTLPLRHSAVIICSLYYILLTAFVALAYFRSTDLWVKARLAAIRGSMEMLCACFHYGVPNPEDEEYPLLLVDTPFLQSVVSIYGPLGYGPSTLPLRHSAVIICSLYYILLTAFVALAYFRSTDLWVKARLAAIRGSMEMLCACFHYGVPNPEDEEYPLLLVDTPFLQSVVSIYGPLGYGPSTLPLRHSAVIICSLYYILLTAFVALAYFRSTDLWVKARLAAIRGSMEMLCACFHYGVPNPEDEEYPLLLVDTPFLQSVVSIYGPLGYGPSTLPLRHSAVIICSLYYILLTAFVALAYFRSTDLWVKARLAAIRGSMEMLCACFHYGVPNPEDEEYPLLLVDTPFLQSVVSIYGPLGYGPSTLPLPLCCHNIAYFRSTDLWVKARLAAIRGSMEMLCACFHYGVPNPEDEEYPLLLVDTPFLQSVVSIYGPLGYGPSTLPLRHSAVIICSLYYILLTAFVALAYFRSTDLWVKARLAAIRGSMEMLCACFHYGVPNPEDEEYPLLLVDTPFLQSVVSIYGPLGYGPSTLPLRHSAVIICSLYYILLTAFVALAYFRSTDLWVKARLAAIRGSMEMLCACFHYGVPNPEDEEYPLLLVDTLLQSVVSIYGPLGYGPSTLPLRHSAVEICCLHYVPITAFVAF